MKNYTIEEQDAIGKSLATIFKMKRSKEHTERYQTAWGDKTAIGIFNTFLRLTDDIKAGDKLEA